MKKGIAWVLAALLLSIGIAGTFWGTSIAEAASAVWNSCPRGEVDCEYPGKCNSYIDTNKDSICDRSQSAPAQVTTTPSQAGASGTTVVSKTTGTAAAAISEANAAVVEAKASVSKHSYYFIPILLVLGLLYALTWILSHRRIITGVIHRRIWNLVLLVSTLISALLGLFLILRIDFNIDLTLPFNMLFWHVEAGIALGIVAVFHILWHWRYFTKILKASPVVEKTTRVKSSTTALLESQVNTHNSLK